ncbi:ABC transporter permease [Phytohabitans sp. ZYX-F-186]|uniref:ABC transporter permease n=1 Tax=Phytohabitans maris TaxID=3071409 RepID=A0ABU0ZJ88_9ACTN|nr:ABC transporter permease [Phytohabitans sp. ZYX-F-186]MDQ7907114.1 ABC transporter permease [Phytohabitans sp. ZYX-F-186]
MSAVWLAARAAVRRRRLQTAVVGIVVGVSTTMIVVALGLLAVSSGPFDQAYARQLGAHLAVTYDRAKATDAQLTAAAGWSGVEAVAGPFPQATVELGALGRPRAQPLTVVGRADPEGPVDRLNVWDGRWATAPGEIVVNQNPVGQGFFFRIGDQVTTPEGGTLTVVGRAFSMSRSADAWVSPEQMATLGPTATQMLYRFAAAGTTAQVEAGQAEVTKGVPAQARLGSTSYLVLRNEAAREAATYVTFLVAFGLLGLAVAILIVANVVSGAVVAGFRHIGVLKALGFTPTQVLVVYLTMVSVPAVAGCALGTVLGNVLARPLLSQAFRNLGSAGIGVPAWVSVAALLGVPLMVALSALVPALRARRLPAAEAISAGSAQHAGRGLRAQRWLSGTRLPRAVSLGLGLPFARPARSALTMAAVVLGVTSVTLAIGLGDSLNRYQRAEARSGAVQVEVFPAGGPRGGSPGDEALLRSVPGTRYVLGSADVPVRQVGNNEQTMLRLYKGDTGPLGQQVLDGRWPSGPGEVAVAKRFLVQRGLSIGDTFTIEAGQGPVPVRIVGMVLYNETETIVADWSTAALVAPDAVLDRFEVQLAEGTDPQAYMAEVTKAAPNLVAVPPEGAEQFVWIVLVTVTLLTLMLAVVAALGVFNTAVLSTRERRRDLGMLKSIGMTPGQVVVMVVTSMAALGALGGLLGIPIGVAAHRVVLPAMADAAQVGFPASVLDVYKLPILALLALAGVAIAAVGALMPARSAARVTIAEVLHNE